MTSPQGLSAALREWERIDGVLGFLPDPKIVDQAKRRGAIAVSTVNLDPHSRLPLVSQDDCAVGKIAAQELLGRCFANFGYHLTGQIGFALERLRGFRETLDSAGHVCHIFECNRTITMMTERPHPSFERKLVSWLKALGKPVAIFAGDDHSAANIVDACDLAGLSVPDDVAVIGADNDDAFCTLVQPALSSIEMPGVEIGYRAAQLLHDMLSGGPVPEKPILLRPLRTVVRQSSDITVSDDPVLSVALQYIHEHAHEGVGTKQLAGISAGVSVRTLHRRFIKLIGHGPGEELIRARMARAKELLASTDLTVEEIALRCGWSNGRTLSSLFRRRTGETPKSFRDACAR